MVESDTAKRAKQKEWSWQSAIEDYKLPSRGELREGTVLSVQSDALLVDVGAKRDAVVPAQDLKQLDADYVASLSEGDTVWVRVLRPLNVQDELTVSLRQGLAHQTLIRAEGMQEAGDVFEAEVRGYNRGGLLVDFEEQEVFVPNSQCAQLPRALEGEEKEAAKSKLVGESLMLCFVEVDLDRRRMVASERAAQRRAKRALLEKLEPGEVRTGKVTGLADFGAFVDIGGLEGLVHVSELAHRYVNHPSEELSEGAEIEVQVLGVDLQRGRISLSRRRVLPQPQEFDDDLGVN